MRLESVGLWGECGEFWMPGRIWLCVLGLARHYGWTPRGTLPPEDGGGIPELFDGGYYPSCAQRIHMEEVVALATALEKALPDLPDIDTDPQSIEAAYWSEKDGPVLNVVAELGGRNKSGLREFIDHCREGGEIWIC
jgi:hypothetical protein